MQDDVEARDGIKLDSDEDIEWHSDNEDEEDEEEDDEEQEEEEDEEDEEDEDEDDGKEPRTIGQRETVNTSADNVDTMVDYQPIMLPEQAQEMREHTPQAQPPAPAPRPQTLQPHQRPQTLETNPISGLKNLGLVTPRNLAQRCQLCEKLRQPETPWMWMWISSY